MLAEFVVSVAVSADEDSDDKRTAGDTELQWHRHTWDSERNATKENTNDDADEDGGDVRSVETLERVAHKVGNAVHIVGGTNHKEFITHLEAIVARSKHIHALT